MSTRLPHLHQKLEAALVSRLQTAGFTVELQSAALESGITVSKGAERYVAELRVCKEPRSAELQGALADALLRARAAAKAADDVVTGGRGAPLAVVGLPRLTEGLAQRLREYADRFGGGDAWGVLDSRGWVELRGGPALTLLRYPTDANEPAGSTPLTRKVGELFSDRHQWMLKVLLANTVQGTGAPSRQVPRSASELARQAHVSLPSAARLVASLRKEGFLAPNRRALVLTRVEELLHRWRSHLSQKVAELPARWLIPATNVRRQLTASVSAYARRTRAQAAELPFVDDAPAAAAPRVALALFAAAEQQGFPPVHGAPQHLYLEVPTAESLEALGLRIAAEGEAPHLWVRRPAAAEAVFRAALPRAGAPCADVLQCWLDLSEHPACGAELSARLWSALWKVA